MKDNKTSVTEKPLTTLSLTQPQGDELRQEVFRLSVNALSVPEMQINAYFGSAYVTQTTEHQRRTISEFSYFTVDGFIRALVREGSMGALWNAFVVLNTISREPTNGLSALHSCYLAAARNLGLPISRQQPAPGETELVEVED